MQQPLTHDDTVVAALGDVYNRSINKDVVLLFRHELRSHEDAYLVREV